MNKKEILEIRKQFSPENCAITRICGCYVDGDVRSKKMEFKEAFLSLPEEESFKYFRVHFQKGPVRHDRQEPDPHGIPPGAGACRRYTGALCFA